MKKPIIAGVALLVLAGTGLVWQVVAAKNVSDQQLIETALKDSIKASGEGRVGGVLDFISANFTMNNDASVTRAQIAQAIKDYQPTVEVESKLAEVAGDAASIVSPVTLTAKPPINVSFTIPEARLEFARENSVKWLVIPEKKWRLTKVTIPEESMNQIGF